MLVNGTKRNRFMKSFKSKTLINRPLRAFLISTILFVALVTVLASSMIKASGLNTLSGTITDGNDSPVAGVTVYAQATVDGQIQLSYGTSDLNGYYSMSVTPGVYALSLGNATVASGTTLHTSYGNNSVDASQGDVGQNIKFKTRNLQVTVKDTNGNPIANAQVVANAQSITTAPYLELYTGGANVYFNGFSLSGGQFTDEAGILNITVLEDTIYGVSVGESICADDGGARVCLASELIIDGNTSTVEIISNTNTISGVATYGSSNTPVSNMNVNVEGYVNGNRVFSYATTDNNGNYTMKVIPATYAMRLGSATMGANTDLATSYGPSSLDATTSDVVKNIHFKTRIIEVQVKGEDNNPMANVQITAQAREITTAPYIEVSSTLNIGFDSFSNPQAFTDLNGRVYLTVIEGNIYRTNYGSSICAYVSGAFVCLEEDLIITENTQSIVIVPVLNVLSGRLTDSQGNGIPNQTVNLRGTVDGKEEYAYNYSDINGYYSINVKPGVYALSAQTIEIEKGYTSLGNGYGEKNIDLSTGDAVRNFSVNTVEVIVTVRDDQGVALTNVRVGGSSRSLANGSNYLTVGPDNFNVYYNDSSNHEKYTDENGQIKIKAVVGARYKTFYGDSICAYITGAFVCLDEVLDITESTQTATIVLDNHGPTITHEITPAPNSNGWNNTDVTLTFTCSDPSGVQSCPDQQTVTTEGYNQVVTATATDNAGNSSSIDVIVNVDKTDPGISYSLSSSPNGNGWHDGDVTVTFTCNDALSGIDSCTSPVTVSSDGSNQTVTGTAVDNAGNTKLVIATIRLDKTNPTITYSLSPAPNSNGWNNSDVTVAFSCSDATSGVNTCTSPVTVSTEGASQTVTGTVTDNAGNTNTVTATVQIDMTKPTTGAATWSDNPITPGNNTTLSVPTTDELSGVAGGEYFIGTDPGEGGGAAMNFNSSILTATFGANLATGTYNIGVRSLDSAGNWSTVQTVQLTVRLSAPTNLQATSPTRTAPVLNWNLVSGADHYNIYRQGTLVGSSTTTGFTDTTVATSGAYSYTVTAVTSQNIESAQSNSVSVVYDITAPAVSNVVLTPAAINPGQTSTLSATVTDNLTGVSRVEYYQGTDPGQGNATAMTSNNGSYAASVGSNLTTPGAYTFSVRAKDGVGNWSVTQTVQLVVKLPAPLNLRATSPTQNPSLHWKPVKDAVGYDVYRDGVKIGSSSNQNYTDTTAPEGTHSYFVEAVDVYGVSSDPSNTVSVLVDRTAPSLSTANSPTTNAAGWNNSPVTITAQASDTSSGVAQISYTVSGAQQTSGTVVGNQASVVVNVDGISTVTFTATDNAGNTTTTQTTIKLDRVGAVAQTPQVGSTTVTVNATDDLSGVATVRVTFAGISNTVTLQATCVSGCGTISAQFSVSTSSLPADVYQVTAKSTDVADNTGQASGATVFVKP